MFNMGVGMVAIVPPEQAERALEVAQAAGERAFVIGEVAEGVRGVVLEGLR